MHQDDCLLIQFSHQKILDHFSRGPQPPFFIDFVVLHIVCHLPCLDYFDLCQDLKYHQPLNYETGFHQTWNQFLIYDYLYNML